MAILQNFLSGIGPFFILLGLLIFVHELGHFLVAKFFKVRVETFSLGFGHKILKFKRGDTTYCISWIPLGGYVKMYGDDPSVEIPESEKQHSFLHKPVGPRIAVVLAGPIMNLIFAAFLFFVVGLIGEEMPSPTVGDVYKETTAYSSGFRSGDKIVKVGSTKPKSWIDVQQMVQESTGKNLELEVQREGSNESAKISVVPTIGDNENILSRKKRVGQVDGLQAESQAAIVGVMDSKSPAGQAGFKNLDLIVSIDNRPVDYFRELEMTLRDLKAKGTAQVAVKVRSLLNEKNDKEERTLNLNLAQMAPEAALNSLGFISAELIVYRVKAKSPAANSDIQAGDRVTHINNQSVQNWQDVVKIVKSYKTEQGPIHLQIVRDDQSLTKDITPELTELMNQKGQEEARYTIGIVSGFIPAPPKSTLVKASSLGEATLLGFEKSWEWSNVVVMSFVRLIEGSVSAKNIGGIITIGRAASHSFESGMSQFIKMMAIISINLFLLNLLPVPVLDGGHLVFYLIEAIRGVPVSLRKMEIAQQVGMFLLLALMIFALFNDISNWLGARW